MAYSKVSKFKSVFGNKRVEGYLVTADAASGAVDTGLSVVEVAHVSPVSMATAAIKAKANLNSGATALNGSVMFSAAASGDDFYLVVYGR